MIRVTSHSQRKCQAEIKWSRDGYPNFVKSYPTHQFWILVTRMLISQLRRLFCLGIESLDSKPAHQEIELGMYIVYWKESKTVYTNIIYNSSLPMASLCPKMKSNTEVSNKRRNALCESWKSLPSSLDDLVKCYHL